MDNIEEIISKIKDNSEQDNKKLAQELTNNLSDSQNDALNRLLSNKDLLSRLMNTPQAQSILKKLGGEDNGHK